MGSCSSMIDGLTLITGGQLSPFYLACQNGDIEAVQKMLPNLTYEQVNRIEPNGNTALHAACFNNRSQIVKLLLDSGCSRTIVNSHRLTAYQGAANDEIRALFDRPSSKRFIDENLTESFSLLTNSGDNVKMEHGIPDDWFKGHTSADNAEDAKFMISMTNTMNPFKKLVKRQTETEITQNVDNLISNAVPQKHSEYKTMCNLHNKFMKNRGVCNLLTMYTLETPLYTILQNRAGSFSTLIYFHLHELEDRAFQGRTYRGGAMTQNDINAYRWALEREGYVLETRTLQSTSLDKLIAQSYSIIRGTDTSTRYSVLLTFDFPARCPTAINLNKISAKIPALSAFEHEKEVLILPFTLFSVKEIKVDTQSGQYRIALTNVPIPK